MTTSLKKIKDGKSTLSKKSKSGPSHVLEGQVPGLGPSEIDKIIARIKDRLSTCLAETGADLIEAKKLVEHGEWESWLKKNFGWSPSLAQKLMNVAKDPKSVKFTDLPKAARYLLSAPSTPEEVKDEIAADVKAGKKPTVESVKAKIAAAKQQLDPVKTAKPISIKVEYPEPVEVKIGKITMPPPALPKEKNTTFDIPKSGPELLVNIIKSISDEKVKVSALAAVLEHVGVETSLEALCAAFPGADFTVDIGGGDADAA